MAPVHARHNDGDNDDDGDHGDTDLGYGGHGSGDTSGARSGGVETTPATGARGGAETGYIRCR